MKKYILLLVLLLTSSAFAAAPSLVVDYEVTPTSINPGGSAQVVIDIANQELLTDIENVKVTLMSREQGIYVSSGGTDLGTISASSSSSAAFGIKVRDEARSGTYILEGKVAFEYGNGDSSSSRISIPVTVGYRSALEIFAADTQITPGATDIMDLTLQNSGKGDLQNVVVTLSPSNNYVYPVGSIRKNINNIAPGESAELSFDIRASDAGVIGIQPVTVTVAYTDAGGSTQTDTQSIAVTIVEPGTEIVVDEINSELEPGRTEAVEIIVENVGDVDLKDLYFSLATPEELKVNGSNEKMLSLLKVGEAGSVVFEFDVSQDAEARPAESTLSITYQRGESKKKVTETKEIGLTVTGVVDLRVVDLTVDKGDSEMEIDIANYGSKAADAIRVDVYSDGTDLGTGFTDTIKPNKHKVFRFDVPTTTSVRVVMQYKDYESGGESIIETTLPLKSEDIATTEGAPIGSIVVLVLLVVVVFWYLRRRSKNKVEIDISKYKK